MMRAPLAFDHSFRAERAYRSTGIFLGQQAAAHAAGSGRARV